MHLQGSARLGVFKIRVADTFLSTDRGAYLYWKDTHPELGAAPDGCLHGHAPGGVDQQQLRERHLCGVH